MLIFSQKARNGGGRVLRRLAIGMSAAMGWLAVGPSVGAAYVAAHQPRPKGHVRKLNAGELSHIAGATGGGSVTVATCTATSYASGPTYSWQPEACGTNVDRAVNIHDKT